ncbi:MAG: hypothetical protein MUF83_14590 [Acidimicrobiales bacterium]|jgi:hypothetical protein|nr:hypothetical protein [Acidimicrobiales bacterium]
MRRGGVLVAVVLAVVGLVACDDINTVVRPDAPVVLTGSQLPDLLGADPDRIVAFAHSRPDGVPTWTRIPVQVDERKVVDFGSQPTSNATAGVEGTVYGTAPIGVTALQYADPSTFVGPDGDATFDADDELVFMVRDGGGMPRAGEEHEPAGVLPGSGVVVRFDDPRGDDQTGWVYLFRSDGTLGPWAGRDHVRYDFTLTSGPYRTTYLRADGPNPETSTVQTPVYRVGFGDRWIESSWRVDAGGATGVDVLDGVKNRFGLGTCGRSNATFADGEGAFVANIDGPVRAIRSYVGANSGPLTQRTHLLYRDREEILTDLRVHAIPGIMDFLDFSAAARGMTYRSSTVPGGVTIDGSPDAVGTGLADWELVTGPQGSVLTTVSLATDVAFAGGYDGAVDWFYADQANSAVQQCWGDAHFYGAAGTSIVLPIPNTDPRVEPWDTLQARRTIGFAGPGVDAAAAADWAADVTTPLVLTVSPYAVPGPA